MIEINRKISNMLKRMIKYIKDLFPSTINCDAKYIDNNILQKNNQKIGNLRTAPYFSMVNKIQSFSEISLLQQTSRHIKNYKKFIINNRRT